MENNEKRLNKNANNGIFVRGIDKVISELPTLINLTLQFDYYVFIIMECQHLKH